MNRWITGALHNSRGVLHNSHGLRVCKMSECHDMNSMSWQTAWRNGDFLMEPVLHTDEEEERPGNYLWQSLWHGWQHAVSFLRSAEGECVWSVCWTCLGKVGTPPQTHSQRPLGCGKQGVCSFPLINRVIWSSPPLPALVQLTSISSKEKDRPVAGHSSG